MTRRNGDLRPAAEKSDASSAGALDAPGRPLRVLLTEDSRDNRIIIRAYLKSSGARVDESENGLIAVEKATTEKYDLVLMDIRCRWWTGLRRCGRIRCA